MDAKTLSLMVVTGLLLADATGLSGVMARGCEVQLSRHALAGDLKRGMFEAQAAVGISGEIYLAAEPHTSSAQVRGGLSPFFKMAKFHVNFKRRTMIARMLFQSLSFGHNGLPQTLMTSKNFSRIS